MAFIPPPPQKKPKNNQAEQTVKQTKRKEKKGKQSLHFSLAVQTRLYASLWATIQIRKAIFCHFLSCQYG